MPSLSVGLVGFFVSVFFVGFLFFQSKNEFIVDWFWEVSRSPGEHFTLALA